MAAEGINDQGILDELDPMVVRPYFSGGTSAPPDSSSAAVSVEQEIVPTPHPLPVARPTEADPVSSAIVPDKRGRRRPRRLFAIAGTTAAATLAITVAFGMASDTQSDRTNDYVVPDGDSLLENGDPLIGESRSGKSGSLSPDPTGKPSSTESLADSAKKEARIAPAAPGATPPRPTGLPASSSATATPTAPLDMNPANSPEDGYLWSNGKVNADSNDYWAQSEVTVKNVKPLTQLTIELRIAKTDGVSSTGSWSTVSSDDYDVRVWEDGGALVYRWTLKSGRPLPTGTHVFAGQYNHAEGDRDIGSDLYTAQGDGSGGPVEVRGDFSG